VPGDRGLRRSASPHGTFARLGGEEFAALLPGYHYERATKLAEELRTAIGAVDLETRSGPLRITASLGCVTLDEVDGSTDAFITLADERLYAAKRAGRNQVFKLQVAVS
jgi:diguanylate cyclase (GGDEF)-like protein